MLALPAPSDGDEDTGQLEGVSQWFYHGNLFDLVFPVCCFNPNLPPRSRKSSVAFACDRLTPSGGNLETAGALGLAIWGEGLNLRGMLFMRCMRSRSWRRRKISWFEKLGGLKSVWHSISSWILPDCLPLLALVFLRNLHWVESFIAKTSNHLAGAKTSCSIQEGWCREWRWRFCTFRCLEVAA